MSKSINEELKEILSDVNEMIKNKQEHKNEMKPSQWFALCDEYDELTHEERKKNFFSRFCKEQIFMSNLVGYVSWFDKSTGEGMIRCPELKSSFYVHWSAITVGKKGCKNLEKYQPVKFSLYENLYMKQVDSIEPIAFDFKIKDEKLIQQLMNDAWEDLDATVFKIADIYYKGKA